MSGNENKGGGGGAMAGVHHGIGAANIATQLAQGHWGWATVSAAVTVALNPKTYEAVAEAAVKLTKAVAPVARAIGNVGKHVPVVGAVITAGFVAYEVGSAIADGKMGKAGAALAAGATEMVVNGVGGGVFGASDLARQAVVEGIVAAGGDRANDAYLVSVGKRVVDVGSRFVANATAPHDTHAGTTAGHPVVGHPATTVAAAHVDPHHIEQQQQALIKGDHTFPQQVTMGGKQVDLDDALRNPTFARTFRENLVKADHAGHLDSKPLLAKLDQFDRMESQRTTAIAAANHPTTTTVATAHPTTLRPATQGMSA